MTGNEYDHYVIDPCLFYEILELMEVFKIHLFIFQLPGINFLEGLRFQECIGHITGIFGGIIQIVS